MHFKEMIVIFISDYLGVKTKGHQNYEFVDAFLNGDNRLFIDPCMIEGAEDPWSQNAVNIMRVFFDCLFEGLRKKRFIPVDCFLMQVNKTQLNLVMEMDITEKGKPPKASGIALADSLCLSMIFQQ